MCKVRVALVAMVAGVMAAASAIAWGQSYPSKAVRLYTSPAGGGNDLRARVIAQELAIPLAQAVVVENRPLVNSIESVAKAAPDGYSLLLAANTVWTLPFMQSNVPWDPLRDF